MRGHRLEGTPRRAGKGAIVAIGSLALLIGSAAQAFRITPIREKATDLAEVLDASCRGGEPLRLRVDSFAPRAVDPLARWDRYRRNPQPAPTRPPPSLLAEGDASYYHDALAGRPTASGEPYRPGDLTAAHRSLPLGTRVKVVEPRTGRSVLVTINDRGPFVTGRVIDLSRAAAAKLGLLRRGVARVRVERVVDPPAPSTTNAAPP